MNSQYSAFLKNYDAMSSGLLGSFDKEQTYTISDDILAELLKAKKLITSFKLDKIEAVATAGSYTFNFVVFIQEGENNKKRAGIFLEEKIESPFIKKQLFTPVSSFVDNDDNSFIEKVKKQFNLFIRDESLGVDLSNIDLAKLLNKLKLNENKIKTYQLELLSDEKMYVLKMLDILKSDGIYAKQFISNFKKIITQQKLKRNDPRYWNKLKLELDKYLIENFLAFSEATKLAIGNLQQNFMDKVDSIKDFNPKPKPKSSSKSPVYKSASAGKVVFGTKSKSKDKKDSKSSAKPETKKPSPKTQKPKEPEKINGNDAFYFDGLFDVGYETHFNTETKENKSPNQQNAQKSDQGKQDLGRDM